MHLKRMIGLAVVGLCLGGMTAFGVSADQTQTQTQTTDQTQPVAYDLSQWQGQLSQQQAAGLKNEVKFTILRTQAGDIKDNAIDHNEQMMDQNHIPYGVYSYSYYTSPQHAAGEADELYQRSPYANFYVNDDEEDDTNGQANQSAIDWSQEMHRIDHHRPVVLYSDLSYMNALSPQARNAYDALWVADYSYEPDPSYHYDLWQNSRTHYSPALGQDVDSDTLPYGARSLRYWTKNRVFTYHPRRRYRRRYRAPKIRVPKRISNYVRRRISRQVAKQAKHKKPLVINWKKLQQSKYQVAEFGHLFNAVRHYPSLSFKQKAYVGTLWDWLCRNRPLAFRLMDCSNQYYCSPRVNTLTVKARGGIFAYNFWGDSKRIGYLKKGTRIKIAYFRYQFFHGMEITKAVAKYRGRWITFSTNKNVVVA